MSRIDDLIRDLCPNGVPYQRLAELARRNSGTPITAGRMKALQTTGGPIRIFAGGNTVADVAEDALPAAHVTRDPSIIVKSRGHIGFTFYDRPFSHKNELWSYTVNDRSSDQRFVYHYLLTQVDRLQVMARANSVKLPQLTVKQIDGIRIPVPPLEVQREVVRILDSFESIQSELKAELEAEVDARRKQRSQERLTVLNYGLAAPSAPIGEVFAMRAGSHVSAADISELSDVEHPYPCFGGNGIRGFVSSANHSGRRVLVGRQGALCGNVRRHNGDFFATEHAVVLTPLIDIDIDWAFHLLTEMDLNQYATKSAQPGLAVGNIARVLMPLPDLDVQRNDAAVLDALDELYAEIAESLASEIRRRREQYEYYRDRLLAFEEAT